MGLKVLSSQGGMLSLRLRLRAKHALSRLRGLLLNTCVWVQARLLVGAEATSWPAVAVSETTSPRRGISPKVKPTKATGQNMAKDPLRAYPLAPHPAHCNRPHALCPTHAPFHPRVRYVSKCIPSFSGAQPNNKVCTQATFWHILQRQIPTQLTS